MDPGKVLVPSNFNANDQAYEPAHPNRDGIFTTIGGPKKRTGSLKTLWKRGYRTVRWESEDPNSDELRYSLYFRREIDEDGWLMVGRDLEDKRFSFDSTVLPDGRYRLKVVATDAEDNAAGEELTASKTSDVVTIDHTPPQVDRVIDDGATGSDLAVEASDALSRLREAVYSFDATEWREATAADGLVDGRSEVFSIPRQPGAHLLLLRLTDAAFNLTTYDLSEHLQ